MAANVLSPVELTKLDRASLSSPTSNTTTTTTITSSTSYDVIISGSGSAGLLAALSLAIGGIKFCLLEKRSGPLTTGQADGVQCRTVEIFDSLNLAEDLLREGYHVIDLSFWDDSAGSKAWVERTESAADTPRGLSHCPHVILAQARVNALLLGKLRDVGQGVEVLYGHEVSSVSVAGEGDGEEYPVTVDVQVGKERKVLRAKYVLYCDSSDTVWGVIDLVPRTNFPDIRRKTQIRSSAGSLVIIPREGGQMVRFYVALAPGTIPADVTAEIITDKTAKIMKGYTLEVVKVFWSSAYTIGQRLASEFGTPGNRIMLAGDACHTHSPKAGQGMNVSLADGHNIGWKLVHVLRGLASPDILDTYIQERRKVAADLLDYDRKLNRLYREKDKKGTDAEEVDFTNYVLENTKYLAGLNSRYSESMLTDLRNSEQTAARNVPVGMRCPSVGIVRHCDGKGVQLHKVLPMDNWWRVLFFAGDISSLKGANNLANTTASLSSSISSLGGSGEVQNAKDSIIEPIVIVHRPHLRFEIDVLPEIFRPITGEYGIRDLYRVYTDELRYDGGGGDAFDTLGIDLNRGAVIVVRPDQYVSGVYYPEQISCLRDFFGCFLL